MSRTKELREIEKGSDPRHNPHIADSHYEFLAKLNSTAAAAD